MQAMIALAFAAGLVIASPVAAHSFPSKPFIIIVPGAPGGAPEVLARAVSQQLTR